MASASYNPSNNTVTLSTPQRLNVHKHYRLTVNGSTSTGVRGASGSLIYAASVSTPGTDYVATISFRNLAGAASALNSGSSGSALSTRGVPAAAAVDHLLVTDSLPNRSKRPVH